MSNTSTKPGDLGLPVYATKPQRRVPGTVVIAVTMHRSTDGSVRRYRLFTPDGEHLGEVSYHGSRRGMVVSGYHLGSGVYETARDAHFDNLTEIARHLVATKGA